MPQKIRKIRKKRGTRTCGWGRIGQHRKAGQRGGRGKAGRHKHLWSYVLRYEPDYFTKKGFYSPQRRDVNTLNVGELEELAVKLSTEKSLGEKDGIAFLDLDDLGYNKLLGMGKVAKPFSIKVASCSKSAVRKVEDAGGKIVKEESTKS
jgi:large subunit ribosomal protein L15